MATPPIGSLCRRNGCLKPAALCCPRCLSEGLPTFYVCAQSCLDLIWQEHIVQVHSPCRRVGCGKPSPICCPVCLREGKDFRVCTQTCLDLLWAEHSLQHESAAAAAGGGAATAEAKVKWNSCKVAGCQFRGEKQCPKCLLEGMPSVYVCSQEHLEAIWTAHWGEVHSRCRNTACSRQGTQCCPVCRDYGRDFRVCSQPCLDTIWADHHQTHTRK